MSESLIKTTFVILGTVIVSLILFLLIMGPTGQNFFWKAIEPVMLQQWRDSTMDNGGARTLMYEEQFQEMQTQKYNDIR